MNVWEFELLEPLWMLDDEVGFAGSKTLNMVALMVESRCTDPDPGAAEKLD